MKKQLVALAVAGGVLLGGLVAAAPAQAACNPSVGKTSTSTSVYDYTAQCDWVQAGIWRYVTVAPTHYVSATDTFSATVSASNGTNAGNDVRTNVHGWTFI